MEERLERVLPNNLDAEKSVLGSMLLEKDALELVLEQLKTEDFYSAAHQHIFEAMANIRAAGHAVDLVTLSEELELQDTFILPENLHLPISCMFRKWANLRV